MSDKPLTPEEFAENIWRASINFEVNKERSIKWLVEFATDRDESIRREMREAEHIAGLDWLSAKAKESQAYADAYQKYGEYVFSVSEVRTPIDTPPAAPATISKVVDDSFNGTFLAAVGDAVRGFCALCSSCGGCTKGHIHCLKCACHGTGQQRPADSKQGEGTR